MVLELEHGVFRIEAHLDRVFLLEQHRFEQVGRLLGQDERRSHFISGFHLVFHQLVGVGTHECKHRRGQVDIDAVHHGTQLVVGRGENRFVDAVHQHVHIERQLLAIGRKSRDRRIAHGAGAGNRERTAFPTQTDLPVLIVHFDRQRHFGELLQRIEHQFGRSCDGAFAFDAVHANRAHERGFQIGSSHPQLIPLELHQEIIQDGQCIFIADYFAGRGQEREQCRT